MFQTSWSTPRNAPDHALSGIARPDKTLTIAKISLICGEVFALTIGNPNIWPPEEIVYILSQHGLFVIERSDTDSKDVKVMFGSAEGNGVYVKLKILRCPLLRV